MIKRRIAALIMLTSIALTMAPAMFYAQGQIQTTQAQQLVDLADRAAQQVQNLIDMIKANDTALAQIDAVGLTDVFEGNVTLYETEGLNNLTAAQDALAASDYEAAVDYAFNALKVFREVYSSIHVILESADLQKGHLIENQGLLEAITRELQRIDRLGEILPAETPQEIFALLEDAKGSLNEARTLLLEGDATAARSTFLEAKHSISEIYQYLKVEAEESDTWRLRDYCEGLQQRIQERFRYGQEQGIDVTGVLQSQGYQSETQYMTALETSIQTAESAQSFGEAMQNCQIVSQMVQQMEQVLNQEINQHQGQYGSGGSGSDSGGSGSGSGYGGPGGP